MERGADGMPSFEDFANQLADLGIKIVDEDQLTARVSKAADWVIEVVEVSVQGRKAGCWFKRAANDSPPDEHVCHMLSGYGFTEAQKRLFIQNLLRA